MRALQHMVMGRARASRRPREEVGDVLCRELSLSREIFCHNFGRKGKKRNHCDIAVTFKINEVNIRNMP